MRSRKRPIVVSCPAEVVEEMHLLAASAGFRSASVASVEEVLAYRGDAEVLLLPGEPPPDGQVPGALIQVGAGGGPGPGAAGSGLDRFDLPGDAELLAGRLVDRSPGGRAGCRIGVVGGCGGAGTSTLAVALACALAHGGREVTLLDADPAGGGLDLLLGIEGAPGLRWEKLAGCRGHAPAAALRARLPALGRVAVLSFGREGAAPEPGTVGYALGALAEADGPLVADLGRGAGALATAALALMDRVLVLTPARLRAVAATAPLLRSLPLTASVGLVVRDPGGAPIGAAAVAEVLGVSLIGTLRSEPRVAAAAERGEPPPAGSSLGRLCRRVLQTLPAEAAGGPP